MKEFVTLKQMITDGYKVLEDVDSRFYALYEALKFSFFRKKFKKPNLIDWLNNEHETAECNDWVYIRKEYGVIALYDVSASMDETYTGDYIDPEKRFEMTVENFRDVVERWEELRVSKPDIILLVIHEDNHVSLETDPKIIQEYQDAGYAFDIDRKYHEA